MAQDLKLQIMLKAVDKVTQPLRGVIQTAEKLRGQTVQTGSELKNLESVQRSIEGHRKLQQKLGTTASKMDQVQKEVVEMGRAIAATDSPTKRQIQQFERAKKQLGKLKTAHRQQKQALQESTGALKKTGIDTRNLSSAEKKLASNISTANQRLNTQASRLDAIRKKTNAATKAKENYDKALQRQANLSFVGAAGYATGTKVLRGVDSLIQPGIAFEEQMSSVGALARINKQSDAFKQLQEQAKQLGASTSFSASEVAQGMQKLAMAGFDASKIMAAIPDMLNLAKAGGNDLQATADIASNILSGFKLEASQMGRVSDVLAATFTRSNVDLEMLGETLKYAAPITQEFGASIEEASALAGLLGNVGIQGSMAGTAMRTMYNNIASHTPAMDALKELDIATRDANGNMIAMPKILAEVARKTEKMGAGDRLAIFKEIAGKQAGAAFASLVGEAGAGAITKFIDVLEHVFGEGKRVADQMTDNTAGDLKSLESAWEGVKLSLFNTNTGPIRELIQHITEITRRLNLWVEKNPELAGQLLKVVAVGGVFITALGSMALLMASVLGPLAMMRYGLNLLGITSMISKLFAGFIWVLAKLGVVIKLVAAKQWLLNIAMNANPIGLVISAVAALIGIGVVLYKNWDAILSWFSEKFDWLKSKFDWIGKTTKAFGSLWNSVFGDDKTVEKTVEITKKVPASKPVLESPKKVVPAVALGVGLSGAAMADMPQVHSPTPIQAKPSIVQHVTNNSTPTININATPDMDKQAIANAVTRELENQQRQQVARQNSQLYDGIN